MKDADRCVSNETRGCHARLLPPVRRILPAAQTSACWGELESTPHSTFRAQTARRTRTRMCTTPLHSAGGLSPGGGGRLPTVLRRMAEIIPVLPDSHRMLILHHLFYCNATSGSSSQLLLLPSSLFFFPLSLTLHTLLHIRGLAS